MAHRKKRAILECLQRNLEKWRQQGVFNRTDVLKVCNRPQHADQMSRLFRGEQPGLAIKSVRYFLCVELLLKRDGIVSGAHQYGDVGMLKVAAPFLSFPYGHLAGMQKPLRQRIVYFR